MIDNRPMAPDLGAPRPRSLPKPAADEAADPIYATPPSPTSQKLTTGTPETHTVLPDSPVEQEPVSALVTEDPTSVPEVPSTSIEPVPTPTMPAAGAVPTTNPAAAVVPDMQSSVQRTPPPRARRQEVFVQVSSRVTVETRDMLDDIGAREGSSMRQTLEKVIRTYYEQMA